MRPTALLVVALCAVAALQPLGAVTPTQSLSSAAGSSWVACTQDGSCVPAEVPGTALGALLANGTFPGLPPGTDPYMDEWVLGAPRQCPELDAVGWCFSPQVEWETARGRVVALLVYPAPNCHAVLPSNCFPGMGDLRVAVRTGLAPPSSTFIQPAHHRARHLSDRARGIHPDVLHVVLDQRQQLHR